MKKFHTTTLAFCFALATTGTALAGAPLETDDAGTVDVGKFEISLSGSYMRDKEGTTKVTSHDAELGITTGLYKNLSVSVALPYTISTKERDAGILLGKDDGFGDMSVDFKYAFAEVGGVNLAIRPGLVLPTGKSTMTEDHLQYTTTLIATKEFNDGAYALHANVGYEFHTYKDSNEGLRRNLWSASVAGEAETVKGLFAVADFGMAGNEVKGTNKPYSYALTGLRYEANDNLDFSAGIKFGLSDIEDDLTALYGLTLKF